MTTSQADVVVVGAGMVGVLCALRLAEQGVRVVIVEQAFAGGGSTGAAMGHIVVMDDTPAQCALAAHSRARWDDILPLLGDDPAHERCGTLWLAATADELASAHQRAAGYRANGVDAEVVDAAALRDLEPALREGLAGALRVPDDGVLYPPAAARRVLDLALSAGAAVRTATVREVRSGSVSLSDGGTIAADAIVIAAGVGSPALIEGLPIVPRKGHLVITARQRPLVHHQLVELGYLASAHTMGGASVAFNVQPRPGGQVLIGSSRELVGHDASINRPLCRAMLERAVEMIPALGRAPIWRTWTGFRPATPDSLPLIGQWRPLPGVWIAAGHEGLGITMAPGTADMIAAGICGSNSPVDMQPFDPCRAMPSSVAVQ